MFLIPYRADVELWRWPLLTITVCLICIGVYVEQASSRAAYVRSVDAYCSSGGGRALALAMKYLPEHQDQHPCELLLEIRKSADRDAVIKQLAADSLPTPFYSRREDSVRYVYGVVKEASDGFEVHVTRNLTSQLQYDPRELNFFKMLTSTFSHADIWHLAGNLVIFYAFAASVEIIAGYLVFAVLILLLAVGTSLAYSYSVMGTADALPTIGLSGVVMGMVAALAVVKPDIGVRCLFWFLIWVRRFSIPALILAVWYIGWDVYDLRHDENSQVNYVAHVSGAAVGVLFGLFYRVFRRDQIRALQPIGS